MTAEEWDKKAGAPPETCAQCGVKIAAGAPYVAHLALRDAGFVREDRCEACAAKVGDDAAFGVWRGRRAALKGPAYRRLDFETLLELFPRLDGREDDAAKRLRWVTALLLLRKKHLVQHGRETVDGVEVLVVGLKHDDRRYRVVDPQMDEAAMAALNDDLAQIFDLAPAKAAK